MTRLELVVGVLSGVLILIGLKKIFTYFLNREDRDDV